MKIDVRKLASIKPYEKNARKIPQKAIDKVAQSLTSFGWQQPIVIDKKGVIVAGHTRYLAALQLGWTEAPVTIFTGTAAAARQYRLMDNRSHQESDWDLEILGLELGELKGLDMDLSLTGFDSRELDSLLAIRDGREDDAPPLPDTPTTQLGDLWLLGGHRLLCGDATDADAVKRVCDGLADGMWTDPPYGVKYVGKTKDALTIASDDADGVEALVRDMCATAGAHLIPNAPFYIAHPPGALFLAFGRAVQRAGWRIHQSLVWAKDSMVLGHSDYHFAHEPILYGFTPGEGRPGRGKHTGTHWYGDHAQTSVFNVSRPKRSSEHPTMKPVELIQRCLQNSVPRGGRILDPFCGSGSSIIAADITDRTCYAIDIDPAYCDVALQRWQTFTGKEACLETGETFESVKASRTLTTYQESPETRESMLTTQ